MQEGKAPISFDQAYVEHIQRTVGPVLGVEHEVIPGDPPISLIFVAPTEVNRCWSVLTFGASAYEMPSTADAGIQAPNRAEYMICLPLDWTDEDEHGMPQLNTPEKIYPIAALKRVARAAQALNTRFDLGATVLDVNYPDPIDSSSTVSGFALAWLPDSAEALEFSAPDGTPVALFTLLGLTAPELEFAHDHGLQALAPKLDAASVGHIFEANRKSVV